MVPRNALLGDQMDPTRDIPHDPRHARLFELIRQDAYARQIADRIDAADHAPIEAMETFPRDAVASLRPVRGA